MKSSNFSPQTYILQYCFLNTWANKLGLAHVLQLGAFLAPNFQISKGRTYNSEGDVFLQKNGCLRGKDVEIGPVGPNNN